MAHVLATLAAASGIGVWVLRRRIRRRRHRGGPGRVIELREVRARRGGVQRPR